MATLKELKRLLKKAGMKSSGSKRALTRRAKKAHLMRGGNEEEPSGRGTVQGLEKNPRESTKKEEEDAMREAMKNAAAARYAAAQAAKEAAAKAEKTEGGRRKQESQAPPPQTPGGPKIDWTRPRPGGSRKKHTKRKSTQKKSLRVGSKAYQW